jgi:DNA-binding response OmpR family regulator
MPPAPGPREEDARLSGARAEFVGSLPRRLEALRGALAAAEHGPDDPDRVNGLLRRVHAVGSAARVLGFASVAEALAEAERSVRKAGPRPGEKPFSEVSRALDLLPSLVLGAPVSMRSPESRAQASPVVFPLSALVLGPEALAEALSSGVGRAPVECERTDDPERALELARMVGPDVAVIDGDHPGARGLVTRLRADDLVEPVPIVVVGSFENPEETRSFVDIGADRVLPKPATPDTLRRTVEDLRERARPRTSREPLGDLSVDALSQRIAAEFKRGLVDALDSGSTAANVPLGDGSDVLSAVWGAVARVRELVTLRSKGELRFQQTGPEGAIPLVAWGASERRAGERSPRSREGSGVSLEGRRVVVADDDPAVVWFMAGLLKAVGVEVIEAHDGKRALQRTLELWPDVVVSDVLMPKVGEVPGKGFEGLEEGDRIPVRPVLPGAHPPPPPPSGAGAPAPGKTTGGERGASGRIGPISSASFSICSRRRSASSSVATM